MSNQRPGKWKRATLRDGGDMRTYEFFKVAAEALKECGHEDPSFYFEQVVEHLREGKGLPSEKRRVESVLGL